MHDVRVEKLMKVRSKEADKKTTKKIVFQKSFYYEEFSNVDDIYFDGYLFDSWPLDKVDA